VTVKKCIIIAYLKVPVLKIQSKTTVQYTVAAFTASWYNFDALLRTSSIVPGTVYQVACKFRNIQCVYQKLRGQEYIM
jgi:hypothetical protein